MNQFGLQYTCAWKQHKESPYIAIFISNEQKCHVFLTIIYDFSSTKSENKRVEQFLPRGGWGLGRLSK
jgi:hypothetical protein